MMNSMSKEMGGMMLMRLAVAVVFIVGGMFLYRMWVVTPALPDDLGNGEIKAVFLDNGQAYFGKISSANKDFLIIDKPYYLQKQTVLQEPVQDGQEPKTKQQLSLTALGGKGLQIHGPERSMYVPWDTVLYIENLRDDSEVVKLITNDTTTDTPTDTTNTNAANTNTAQ
ncbi:MAG: hypothetical protein HYV32_00100 [Candidatus Kerfeldbacteria bacterium]|nr:hypothetical protein [Candidatus Kerfeldbacteria bacterium]